MKLDDFRVCVVPGDGLVARLDGAVVVVPAGGSPDDAAIDRLLAACRQGSLGLRLDEVRAVAAGGVGSFALVAEVDGGVAVHVEGDAQAAISGAAPVLHLSGRAPGWANVFRQPFASLAVGSDAEAAMADVPARLDLRAGVVSGSGVVLVPRDAAVAVAVAPAAPAAAPASAPMVPPAPEPARTAAAPAPMPVGDPTPMAPEPMAPAATAPPVTEPMAPVAAPRPAAVVMAAAEPAAARVMAAAPPAVTSVPEPAPAQMAPPPTATAPPLAPTAPEPAPAAPAPTAPPGDPQPTEVWGIRCKKGHFNDPESRYCAVCGIHMVQDKAVRVRGPRPVLGYLVFDDGKTYKLDTDYVIGRNPHGDDAVRSGQARALVFGAGEDVVSDVHARVILRDWEVLVADCHSLYGTYVWAPGTSEWVRLADEPVMLKSGNRVMLAQRGFMFQPANKR